MSGIRIEDNFGIAGDNVDGEYQADNWFKNHWQATVFWSSSSVDEGMILRWLEDATSDQNKIYRGFIDDPSVGYNVRCIQD